MQRNRRPQFNPINAPALARGLVITAFLTLTGLIYVYLSLQLYDLGKQKTKLEHELAALVADNKIQFDQINALTSYRALDRRLKEGFLKMIPIAERNIVRVNPATLRRVDELRPDPSLQARR